jgi:predicted  nucleic acid-binding Zn-ribbon protein
MLPALESLVVIQDRDLRIIALRKDLAQMPRLVEHARSRLVGDQGAVAKAKEAVQANEVLIKRLELDVQTRRNTVQRLRDQQFQTRKNEEFQALGHEVERYQAEIRKLEDEELVLMEKAEELRRTLSGAEAALRRTQELVDGELAQLDERRKNDEAGIAALTGERETFAAHVEPHLMAAYDRLLKGKQNAVVVALSHGQCKGCHMKVTAATVLQAKAEQELTHCENCGRFLYFED